MFGQGWRLHYVILACFVSLALLGGGHFLYQKFLWEKALVKKLQSVPQVEGVTFRRTKNKVEIKLGPTPDLKQTYLQVEEAIGEFFRENIPEVVIRDERSPVLSQVWEKTQFAVYEAAARGTYTVMAEEIEKIAQDHGVEARLAVDGERIYVALYQDGYFLYEVVPIIRLKVPLGRGENGV
ncbi:MAG: hypothetical protein L5656_07370 [Thermanaeromonas sp.]|uniref:hypothetical protein n=1 Tax=Thermanaeromonas sp. TaxID=2003697 RepID=UPI002438AD2A|nr:hypothetical protein [Thermanaeromonas sp.]MCG0278337.1 hypothetical protein [Thermanaeromonas sp.]